MPIPSTKNRRPLCSERLESRHLLTSVPFGATVDDTGEFMLGDVVVSVVMMESDGSIDVDSERWTPREVTKVKNRIEEGLEWWTEMLRRQNSVHELNFTVDYFYTDHPIKTGYEPISRKSQDVVYWIEDFFEEVGLTTAESFSRRIRKFNHRQRIAHNANWAFTIFVVDAENDTDHRFHPDGAFSMAYAFAGGRFFVITSERPAASIAHETAHMFWALDEYQGSKSYYDHRGYYDTQNLNAFDQHPNPSARVRSIMDLQSVGYSRYALSPSAMEMIGWKDSDHDGVFDVLDVPLQITGTSHIDLKEKTIRFTGTAAAVPLANKNPAGTGNDITLNRVSRIEYRINSGNWQTAKSYGDYEVTFDVTIPFDDRTEIVEIRAIDEQTGISSPTLQAGVIRTVNWQNETNPFDVNNDGHLSPVDALLVINDLNARGSRKLSTADLSSAPTPPPFIDVNGDGYVAPSDAIIVINALNGKKIPVDPSPSPPPTSEPAEGEPDSRYSDLVALVDEDLRRATAPLEFGGEPIRTKNAKRTQSPSPTAQIRPQPVSQATVRPQMNLLDYDDVRGKGMQHRKPDGSHLHPLPGLAVESVFSSSLRDVLDQDPFVS